MNSWNVSGEVSGNKGPYAYAFGDITSGGGGTGSSGGGETEDGNSGNDGTDGGKVEEV